MKAADGEDVHGSRACIGVTEGVCQISFVAENECQSDTPVLGRAHVLRNPASAPGPGALGPAQQGLTAAYRLYSPEALAQKRLMVDVPVCEMLPIIKGFRIIRSTHRLKASLPDQVLSRLRKLPGRVGGKIQLHQATGRLPAGRVSSSGYLHSQPIPFAPVLRFADQPPETAIFSTDCTEMAALTQRVVPDLQSMPQHEECQSN